MISMMQLSPQERMALAVHLNPGGYVPLLGSGVSRAAGIPTGWDIVLNLIRRVAVLRGANELQDPEKWFIETIGARPTFTGILDALQLREEERRKILLPFIEAGGDAPGTARTPTAAHRAIAALVKRGAIRLIITTNIDRLMEAALAEVGVAPVVLSSDAAFKAAPPLHETDCILAKLHGDYREPGVRLTATELEAYPTPIRRFLRRYLSDFGLLVCGWSAEWDGALRDALESVRSYRFSSFWLHLEDRTLVPAAASTAHAMRAFLVPISGADDALQRLTRDFEALAAAQRPHPVTIDLAVERVRLSAGAPQPFADLDALVRDDAEAFHSSLVGANRDWSQTKSWSTDAFMERLRICEQLSARFAQVLAAVAYYHDSAAPKVLRRASASRPSQSRLPLTSFPLSSGTPRCSSPMQQESPPYRRNGTGTSMPCWLSPSGGPTRTVIRSLPQRPSTPLRCSARTQSCFPVRRTTSRRSGRASTSRIPCSILCWAATSHPRGSSPRASTPTSSWHRLSISTLPTQASLVSDASHWQATTSSKGISRPASRHLLAASTAP